MLKKSKLYISLYILVVLIYTAVFCLINFKHLTLLDSSGLGDFLSGLFAPIAFLYLLLGYKQQEKALNQTNQDILEQLKIQEKMLKLQLADQKAREHSAQPIIQHQFWAQDLPFETKLINSGTHKFNVSFKRRIMLEFFNSGEKVSQVNVRCLKPFLKGISFNSVLSESTPLKTNLDISESLLEEYANDDKVELTIELVYCTSLGIHYKLEYEITISSIETTSTPLHSYTAKSSPVRIE